MPAPRRIVTASIPVLDRFQSQLLIHALHVIFGAVQMSTRLEVAGMTLSVELPEKMQLAAITPRDVVDAAHVALRSIGVAGEVKEIGS